MSVIFSLRWNLKRRFCPAMRQVATTKSNTLMALFSEKRRKFRFPVEINHQSPRNGEIECSSFRQKGRMNVKTKCFKRQKALASGRTWESGAALRRECTATSRAVPGLSDDVPAGLQDRRRQSASRAPTHRMTSARSRFYFNFFFFFLFSTLSHSLRIFVFHLALSATKTN